MNIYIDKFCYNTDLIDQSFDCSKCHGHLCDQSSYLDDRYRWKTNVDINGNVVDSRINFCPFCGRQAVDKETYYEYKKLYKQC